MKICKMDIGIVCSWLVANFNEVEKILSISRNKIAEELDLIDKDQYAFCWIVDYPMFELDEQTKKIQI